MCLYFHVYESLSMYHTQEPPRVFHTGDTKLLSRYESQLIYHTIVALICLSHTCLYRIHRTMEG